jgi:hypothetical protein
MAVNVYPAPKSGFTGKVKQSQRRNHLKGSFYLNLPSTNLQNKDAAFSVEILKTT